MIRRRKNDQKEGYSVRPPGIIFWSKYMYNLSRSIFLLMFIAVLASAVINAQSPANGGKVKIAIIPVKTVSVGEGMDAQQLSMAIQNSLTEYLSSPAIELVAIEAKLPSAVMAEMKEKGVDFIITTTVVHKKGGGGFGKMFSKVAPVVGSVIPMAGVAGGMAGAVAGQVASTAIMTAANASQNVKAKDAVELNVVMQKVSDGSNVWTKQLKGKAKSNGEDIISPMIEQAAQAIVDTAAGKPATVSNGN